MHRKTEQQAKHFIIISQQILMWCLYGEKTDDTVIGGNVNELNYEAF